MHLNSHPSEDLIWNPENSALENDFPIHCNRCSSRHLNGWEIHHVYCRTSVLHSFAAVVSKPCGLFMVVWLVTSLCKWERQASRWSQAHCWGHTSNASASLPFWWNIPWNLGSSPSDASSLPSKLRKRHLGRRNFQFGESTLVNKGDTDQYLREPRL